MGTGGHKANIFSDIFFGQISFKLGFSFILPNPQQ